MSEKSNRKQVCLVCGEVIGKVGYVIDFDGIFHADCHTEYKKPSRRTIAEISKQK